MHGTVVRVDKDEVLVDIGYKSEGVIPVAELSIRRSVNPADEVSLGDEIAALVLTKEDAEGRLILSKKRARFEIAWKAIEAAHEKGEPVNGRVIEVVKGGLILDLGVRGFLPASLVDIRRVQDLDEFLGQELRCKVIELNRSRNNVVLSRRAVLEEERKEKRQAILDRLNPGDVVEGTISNIVDFGAFVDLDGMDGLIHISELSWCHVNHPSEVLEIGQTVQGQGARHRPRAPADLARPQADADRSLAAGARQLRRGRRRPGTRHEGRHVRRLRRDPARRRGARPHLRARAAPRREPARGRLAGRPGQRPDPRGRRRAPPPLALAEAGRGRAMPGPAAPTARSGAAARARLSEEVFADERARPPRTSRPAAEAEDETRRGRVADRRGDAEPRRRPRRPRRARARGGAGRRAGARGRGRGRPPRPSRPPRRAEAAAEASAEAEPRARGRPAERSVRRPLAVAITGGIGAGKSEALEAFARHGAATVSSDEIVHHLSPRRRGARGDRRALRRAGRSARTAGSTGGGSGGSSSATAEAARVARGLLHPLVSREYLPGASGSPASPTRRASASPRCRCSTRSGARSASTGSWSSPRRPSCASSAGARRVDDRDARLLPEEEKVRRADFAYVNDGSLEELDAFVARCWRSWLDSGVRRVALVALLVAVGGRRSSV